jgi:hypothetical protein
MPEPVYPRADSAVPNPQASPVARRSSELSTSPGANLESANLIEQLSERLRFYESFDEIIQDNIARSGQLLRDAAEKRDEAVTAIAQSRQRIETERETQRSTLTELLDDVMMIQQATERLAHRVSDALEQIEFELEPIGLQAIGSTSAGSPARLQGMAATGFALPRTSAEDVHDEVNRGVLGGPAPTAATARQPGSMSTGPAPFEHSVAGVASPVEAVHGSPSGEASPHNPETDAPAPDDPVVRDVDSSTMGTGNEVVDHEATVGAGPEGAPVDADTLAGTTGESDEATAGNLDHDVAVAEPPASGTGDELGVVSPAPSSDADEAGPIGDVTSELSGLAAGEWDGDSTAVSGNGTGVTTPPSTSSSREVPVLAGAATDESADSGHGPIDGPTTITAAIPESSVDDLGADTSDRSDAVSVTPVITANAVDLPSPTNVPAVSSSGTTGAFQRPTESGGAAEPREQRTTVVLDGVPRAAVALAIQRHILSKPDVLRAEVREYYDHRLTLFVTGRRATTADDLSDWDGSASWEQIRTSPELLELRMVM